MITTLADLFRSSPLSAKARPEPTVSIIREKIRELSDSFWPWPGGDDELIELYYAIYMEPTDDGGQQPFASLAPRFYFVFRLGWPADATVWLYYHPAKLRTGSIVGDSLFPTLSPRKFEIGSIVGNNVIDTAVPGELAVAFTPEITPDEAAIRLSAGSPNFRIIDVVSVSGNLFRVACRPFAETEDGKTIEAIPGVRYAAPNRHVTLISPGGSWKISRLL